MFLPLTVVLGWGQEKTQQVIALVTENFPVPPDFAERVGADLGPGPTGGGGVAEGAVAVLSAEADAAAERAAAPVWPETLIPAEWPSLRASLAAGILATATPDREDRLFPGDIAQFTAPGGGLAVAHGAAGVLWALGSAGTEIPAAHLDWLTERVRRWAEPNPGFYDGLHGVAYALDALGRTVFAPLRSPRRGRTRRGTGRGPYPERLRGLPTPGPAPRGDRRGAVPAAAVREDGRPENVRLGVRGRTKAFATTADLLAVFRSVPLEGLPGHCGDALEVVIAMEQGEPLQLSGRGDDQVDSSGTPVFPLLGEGFLDLPGAVVGAVVDGNPAEDQSHVLDAARPVGS